MNQGFRIQVNGEPREAVRGATVADLLRELNIRPDRVAVEVNLDIVDRQEYERRNLCEGDRIEILSFIGGGGREAVSHQHSARGSLDQSNRSTLTAESFPQGANHAR
jgi:thiamine biosynthesis protein ThiS